MQTMHACYNCAKDAVVSVMKSVMERKVLLGSTFPYIDDNIFSTTRYRRKCYTALPNLFRVLTNLIGLFAVFEYDLIILNTKFELTRFFTLAQYCQLICSGSDADPYRIKSASYT
jgi:hypothetical protein